MENFPGRQSFAQAVGVMVNKGRLPSWDPWGTVVGWLGAMEAKKQQKELVMDQPFIRQWFSMTYCTNHVGSLEGVR